ncbi:hypothetical protein Ppb6_00350 [Photorhabdus australis subsp. thailandensis]|uniref:Uncharacterized protein n=1 Tax=Photorhabdus australis subsp. thailandensis TaxID=2805096 RepID=A0A1C0U935_9GAMM|nr:hypothetical protein Ppb6_00350 [Photorhabdus australis subsp. thailandensis]
MNDIIPFILQIAALLAAFTYPSHIGYLCDWGCVHLPPRCKLKSMGIGFTESYWRPEWPKPPQPLSLAAKSSTKLNSA